MKSEKIKIRIATVNDAKNILEIYRPYIIQTAITFEYEVPTIEEFSARIAKVLEKYPYLIAEQDGMICGYAYVGCFNERTAYDWAVETSIYVAQEMKHCGIGGKLHQALEAILIEMGILNMNACIAYPQKEDEYLTKNSVEFHTHLGYRWVGEFQQCGYKFNNWYNMVWLEKHIGNHYRGQSSPKSFDDTRDIIRKKYQIE